MGSARVGGSPATSACDPTGQTWDVRDLYVMDERFTEYYEKINPGLAEFMRDAMHHYVDNLDTTK